MGLLITNRTQDGNASLIAEEKIPSSTSAMDRASERHLIKPGPATESRSSALRALRVQVSSEMGPSLRDVRHRRVIPESIPNWSSTLATKWSTRSATDSGLL